jgi:hypothetical protein
MSFAFLLLATSASRATGNDDEASISTLVAATTSSILLTYCVLKLDERRLSEEQLARAWLPASRMVAYVFAPFSLLVHFVRTRRSLVSVLFGGAVVACVLAIVELIAGAMEWLVTP